MPFNNLSGLFALLALIPFIILYLRRPKPLDRVIPSLMFLVKEKKMSKQYAFLRKLLRNLLFFLQLLVILCLGFAVAEPFMKIHYDAAKENTIVVLDLSASMQTKDGSTTRFDNGIKEAKKYLSGKISIIFAENIPIIVLEEGETETAVGLLGNVKPKATTTNIGDAMLLAKDLLKDREGRVVVVSDFSMSDGPDVLVTQRVLTSNDVDVKLIDVSNEANNIGIVDLNVDKYTTKVFIKNFNNKEESVKLKLTKDNELIAESDQIKILPNSIESFVFDTPTGVSKVDLDKKDSLDVDNTAYISTPLSKKIKVLLVTDVKKSNLMSALEAIKDIELEKKYFTPERSLLNNYEVIILNQFQYVPGTFEDLSYYVERGGNLIVSVQDNIKDMEMSDLELIEFNEIITNPTKVCVDVFNQFTKQFEKDKCFAVISKFFKTNSIKDSIVVASADNNPIIVMKEKDEGKVVYYGIFDENSDFRTLPSYPIFWNSLLNFLVETEDISDYNFKTGKMMAIDTQDVKTPSSSLTTSSLLFDEVGIYEFNNKKVAVNLLDRKESDVVRENVKLKEGNKKFVIKTEKKEKDMPLTVFLLVFVFLLILTELFYIKGRGDL